ncbi:MAG: hypothetical protein ACI379_07570 [Nocardioides sp.]|uniref:hypothetical protein n=1 Tax=Nocardioides sp. TaxID=35761 RepID=UPI003F0FE756
MSTLTVRADRKALAEAAAWVSLAIPRLHSTPVLSGIRLRAEGDTLTLSAYGYEISHEVHLEAEVSGEGECLASGAFLRTMFAALPGSHVDLQVDGMRLVMKSGRSEYRTQLLNLEEYPKLPATPPTVGTINATTLGAAVAACAAPVDDAAPAEGLRGLRLEADGALDIVGLSSSLAIHRALDWGGEAFTATVSSAALVAAVKGMSGEVAVGRSESGVSLSDGTRVVVLRTLSGEYAKWRRVDRAPEEDRFAVEVDRDTFAASIKRAGLLARSGNGPAEPIGLVIGPDSIELGADIDGSGGSEVIDAQADGSERIYFAPDLLGSAVAAMAPGPVRLGIGKRAKPSQGGLLTVRSINTSGHRAVVGARVGGEAR